MRALQETIDQLKPDDLEGEGDEEDEEDLDIYIQVRRCHIAFHSNHTALFCSELGFHMLKHVHACIYTLIASISELKEAKYIDINR